MAASPPYKIYLKGEYIASAINPFFASMLIAALDDGEIRYGHSKQSTVWREGQEEIQANESYDRVAEIIHQRLADKRALKGVR